MQKRFDRLCRPLLPVAAVLFLLSSWPPQGRAQHLQEVFEALSPGRPGLAAVWSDGLRTVIRVEERPVFRLRANESPHPQIAPSNFRGRWSGVLNVKRPGMHRFSVETVGRFSLKVNGRIVLTAASQ